MPEVRLAADFESRDLAHLAPEFRERAKALLAACKLRGVIMRPFFTLRGPAVQARLWAQSRSDVSVGIAAGGLIAQGAPYLGGVLNKAKNSKRGAQVTRALPGESWHQWGEAMDCFVAGPNGAPNWDTSHEGYRIYAEEAKALGLNAGYFWPNFPDAVHVQLRPESSPLKLYKWPLVDAAMKERFL